MTATLPTKKPRTKADSTATQVGKVAVEAATELARAWTTHSGYNDVRGAVLYAAFEALALAQGLSAVPLELVAPGIPYGAALMLRLRLTEGLPLADVTPEHYGAAHEVLCGYGLDAAGALVATNGRRKGGVHFTPRELTQKVVARTLEPLLACMESDGPLTASRVLALRVCDPSVGAGAFLLEVVRQLGERVFELGGARDLDEAKRLVALHSCYGVDKDPMAVYAAKLALRLECRADRMPGDWLDDNVRVGDALVGLDRAQIVAFDWRRGKTPLPWLEELYDNAVRAAAVLREERLARLAALARVA